MILAKKTLEYLLVILFAMLLVRFIPNSDLWVNSINSLIDTIISFDYSAQIDKLFTLIQNYQHHLDF